MIFQAEPSPVENVKAVFGLGHVEVSEMHTGHSSSASIIVLKCPPEKGPAPRHPGAGAASNLHVAQFWRVDSPIFLFLLPARCADASLRESSKEQALTLDDEVLWRRSVTSQGLFKIYNVLQTACH
jgi:hypothetical protein